MRIIGKRILITGAARRVGGYLAREFAKAGARPIIHYRDSAAEAEKLAAEIKETCGVAPELARQDLADTDAIADFIARLATEQPIDILVNNASVYQETPVADEELAAARRQFDVNFWAPYELMRAYQRQLPANRAGQGGLEGCIINLLDQRVAHPPPNAGSYSISKIALNQLTRIAASQWAPNVRVNAIAPGPVLPPVGKEDSLMLRELANVPMGRPVRLEDIFKACLMLVENSSITGQTIFVDCGQSISSSWIGKAL